MLASAVELLASGSELHCTVLHICQLDLLGIADYIVFVDRICNVCAKPQLPSLQDFLCPEAGFGVFKRYPDPADCRAYYVCVSGTATRSVCPTGKSHFYKHSIPIIFLQTPPPNLTFRGGLQPCLCVLRPGVQPAKGPLQQPADLGGQEQVTVTSRVETGRCTLSLSTSSLAPTIKIPKTRTRTSGRKPTVNRATPIKRVTATKNRPEQPSNKKIDESVGELEESDGRAPLDCVSCRVSGLQAQGPALPVRLQVAAVRLTWPWLLFV